MRGRALPVLVFVAGSLAVALACGDLAHTNPYDPAVPVTIVITGSDTLFSFGEQATYAAQVTPSFPDTAIHWASADTALLRPTGPATFQLLGVPGGPPLWPATATTTVDVLIGQLDTVKSFDVDSTGPKSLPNITWRHAAYKTVVVTQRVTRIQLRCPTAHACDTLSTGDSWSVWVDGFDALGQEIVALTGAATNPLTGASVATFVARDTTIAGITPVGIRVATVSALRSGTTWIVATRDSLRDSLQLVVR